MLFSFQLAYISLILRLSQRPKEGREFFLPYISHLCEYKFIALLPPRLLCADIILKNSFPEFSDFLKNMTLQYKSLKSMPTLINCKINNSLMKKEIYLTISPNKPLVISWVRLPLMVEF